MIADSVKFIVNGRVVLIDAEDQYRVFEKNWQIDSSGRVGHMQRKKGLPRKWFSLPRFINDTPKDVQIDHINRNPLDNRRVNLRRCTQQQNQHNKPPLKGRFKGVCFVKCRNKWRASIKDNGKHKHLGYFDCDIKAAKAYNERAKKLHGEFVWLNPV